MFFKNNVKNSEVMDLVHHQVMYRVQDFIGLTIEVIDGVHDFDELTA